MFLKSFKYVLSPPLSNIVQEKSDTEQIEINATFDVSALPILHLQSPIFLDIYKNKLYLQVKRYFF